MSEKFGIPNFENPQTQKSQQETAQAIERKITDLLRGGVSLQKMAEILGYNAQDYLSSQGRETTLKGSAQIFRATDFIKSIARDVSEKKIALPDKIVETSKTILSPDEGEMIKNGNGEEWRKKETILRTRYVIEALSELQWPYEIETGKNKPKMMRKLSYQAIKTTNPENNQIKLVLVCDEEGNVTFIIHQVSGEAETETYKYNHTKSQLKSLQSEVPISRIEYDFQNPEEFKQTIKNKLIIGEKLKQEKEDKESKKFSREYWDDIFAKLCDYVDEHGDANVPSRYKKNKKLGKWVSRQRQKYKNPKKYGELTQEQMNALNNIGFQWNVRKIVAR